MRWIGFVELPENSTFFNLVFQVSKEASFTDIGFFINDNEQ